MHPDLSPAAWATLGALAFAPVGALFGALAGAFASRDGHFPGGPAGRAAARACYRIAEREFSPAATGALVGAADGALFLAVIGAGVGLLAGSGRVGAGIPVLLTGLAVLVVLALAAAAFGALGHWLQRTGPRGVAFVFLTCGGGVLGWGLGLFFGAVLGVLGGGLLGLLALAYSEPPAGTEEGDEPADAEQRWDV